MQLLLSMTGATPETRLVLLTWAVKLGRDFQSGSRDALAKALGVSKRNLGTAIEYLVSEGYLWKIKSHLEKQEGDRTKNRYDYALSSECWELWCEFHKTFVWHDELLLVVDIKLLADGSSKDKLPKITTKILTVWLAMLSLSNSARYVVGSDDELLCRLTGVTTSELHSSINVLVHRGVITIAADAVAQSQLFEYLPPIYKMQRQQTAHKSIKLGLMLSSFSLIPMRCISQLRNYYKRACKFAENRRFPSQNSVLSDEQYFNLSEIFSCNGLSLSAHHVFLSSIFSILPAYIYNLEVTERAKLDVLRSQLMASLKQGFSCKDWIPISQSIQDGALDKSSSVDEMDALKSYILDVLTEESVSTVLELADSWRLFVECIGSEGKIVDHKVGERMLSIKNVHTVLGSEAESEDSGKDTILQKDVNEFTSCVLTIMVPNNNQYTNCMVVGQKLMTADSTKIHPNVEHVARLICVSKS